MLTVDDLRSVIQCLRTGQGSAMIVPIRGVDGGQSGAPKREGDAHGQMEEIQNGGRI